MDRAEYQELIEAKFYDSFAPDGAATTTTTNWPSDIYALFSRKGRPGRHQTNGVVDPVGCNGETGHASEQAQTNVNNMDLLSAASELATSDDNKASGASEESAKAKREATMT